MLGWRDVPIDARPRRRDRPRLHAAASRSCSWPATTARGRVVGIGARRMAFCLRKRAEREAGGLLPVAVRRTLVYKGMLTTGQLEPFFPDLSRPARRDRARLVHSRFSTNTFPSWPLAHPYRLIAHNGEINTVQGQPQLDAGPRERSCVSDVIPATSSGCSRSARPARSDSAQLRRGARAAAPRRPLAAARRADDDPRGVGEPRRDGPGPPRVLRVPLHAHGAVGRPGVHHLHRRHAHRRGARPQRAASRAGTG